MSPITRILFLVSGVSREMSLHPAHLTPNEDGVLPPSALVPFCSYQQDRRLLGQRNLELNLTICDKFEPIVLDGQLCYSLDVAKFADKPTGEGKEKGLFLLLDPYPYPLNVWDDDAQKVNDLSHFKIYIHTLAQYTRHGLGAYKVDSLKRMTATDNFKQLPDNQKNCHVHNREECQTQKFLEHVLNNCKCIPWAAAPAFKTKKVKLFKEKSISGCVGTL